MAAQQYTQSGYPGSGGTGSEEEMKEVVRRWFDMVNEGDVEAFDQIMDYDVVDHSALNQGHGGGCDGHKALVRQLRQSFPQWKSEIQDMTVRGDLVTVRHRGRGIYPNAFKGIMGRAPDDPEMKKMDFEIVSTVRVRDGKIVEHWANQSPFGYKTGTGGTVPEPSYPGGPPYPGGPVGPEPPSPGPPTENKRFLQAYVRYVIDGENPDIAGSYFSENFYNHDRAPGEEPGLEGVKAFLRSIYAAFSGFHTTIEEQVGEDDYVVGRWSQYFNNTGPYLDFPPSGKKIDVFGITIVRVRNGKIVEEWEARDAVGLLEQMGVGPLLGPLEGGDEMPDGSHPGEDANKELVKRYFYDVWGAGRLDVVDEIFAPDFVNQGRVRGQAAGRQGMRQWAERWRLAFPDVSVTVDLLITEGDRVVARWTARGTHRGTFMGLEASGKRTEITGISIFRVSGGRIHESWGFWEGASLLMQTGAVKFPTGEYPGPGGEPGKPGPGQSEEEMKEVVRQWFDMVNEGDVEAFDQIMDYDVVDHSTLNQGHGGGCDGHKALVRQLRQSFPQWKSEIQDMTVRGDLVTVRHRGRGIYPNAFKGIMGRAPDDPEMKKMDFEIVSTVRVRDGKIVEHWANQSPFGYKADVAAVPGGGGPPGYPAKPAQA